VTETRDAVHKPLFRRHARRPRLTALLDAAKAQGILVTAPAGYGKTTLAREWLQGRDDVAWYHATSASADVGAFSAGLAEAIAPLIPGAGERVRQRLRVGDATERLARTLAELLAEDLEEWPAGGIVVLDDYHALAESTPVEDFVDWLITLVPIRVLVTSRRRPGWATARRFLYGEVVEIGRNELAMNDEEAGRVLEGRSTDAVRALVRQANGWPALIGLASLSADLEFPPEKVSESLFRYFAEEVLRREPPDVQRFMLLASVASSVDIRLARDVLEVNDSAQILERLRGEDLLHETTVPGSLRFHPLLREFLRKRFKTNHPTEFEKRVRLIIEDATTHTRWEEAFDLALESGNAEEAAHIAGRAARSLLATGQSERLEKWLSACGAAGVTVPGAGLARAELLIRRGEMSAASAVAQDIVRRLTDEHPDHAWASNVAGRALHFTSKEDEAFERFEIAKRSATSDQDQKDALWGLVLTSAEIAPEMMSGYLDELETRFADDIDVRFRLAVGQALALEMNSSLVGAWDRYAALLTSIQHTRDPLAASTFLASGASVALLRADYSVARRLAKQALNYCVELRLDFAVGSCYAYLTGAETGLRRFDRARRAWKAFSRSGVQREDPYFRVEGLAILARLLASQGASDEALATQTEARGALPSRPLGAYLATLAVIEAALGNAAGARDAVSRARRQANSIERLSCSLLAEAIVEDVEGHESAFRTLATSAVTVCGRAEYLDGLVFAYRVYPRLLEVAQEDAEALSILRASLAQSRDHQLAQTAGIDTGSYGVEDSLAMLTPRELDVLQLLSQGMTNIEIAQRLVITSGTAKVHVRHILEKLGVRNRLQAVLRAQELLGEGP
jgi:LuxR family transcriptional regulator, maltose regulon positive regulatory protein